MIKNQDRSGWFGASDTATIMGNWGTNSFAQWWGVKCGWFAQDYHSWAMDVGNIMEHAIVDAVAQETCQRIRKGKFPAYRFHRLRVNYDGLTRKNVIEIKTSGKGFAKVPQGYWMQCQVLMHTLHRKHCQLWLYVLEEGDYLHPYFASIDQERLHCFAIEYDRDWVKTQYLPRLKYLARCLRKGVYPRANAI